MQQTDGYLTIAQAAERFAGRGITAARLYRWIARKRLPAYERAFDGTTMVKPEDVEAVLASFSKIVPKGDED